MIERMWRRVRRWAWGAALVALAGFLLERGSAQVGSRVMLLPSTAVGVTPSAGNTNVNVDPGTALGGTPAPNFRLTDQFGRKIALADFQGKVVLLAFLDSHCTSICPLTTEEMVEARKLLGGAAAREVALVAVNANPVYTGVPSVYAYSKAHGVLHDWYFLTGSLPALKKVWQAYGVSVAILEGAIDHTPAVYLIGPRGEEVRVYMTQLAYAAIGQQAQVFANAMARVLPIPTAGSERCLAKALAQVPVAWLPGQVTLPIASTSAAVDSRGRGGSLRIRPGHPVLLVFFATWLSELSNVPKQLAALNAYETAARATHLPPIVAVDEAPTEPSPSALPALLRKTPTLHYPVVVDTSGTLADSLDVQDLTWYVLLGPEGRILWAYDGSNQWLAPNALEHEVRHAMAHAVSSVR